MLSDDKFTGVGREVDGISLGDVSTSLFGLLFIVVFLLLSGVRFGSPESGMCLEFFLSLIIDWNVKEDGVLIGLVSSLHFSCEGFPYLPVGLLMADGLLMTVGFILVDVVVGCFLELMIVSSASLSLWRIFLLAEGLLLHVGLLLVEAVESSWLLAGSCLKQILLLLL